MRILTFLHSFEPGGVERVALRLVRAWRDRGVEAPLAMGREDGALRDELAGDLPYSFPRRIPVVSVWMETARMIVWLPREIRRVRPDVLFCAGSTYTIVAVAMKLLLGRSCPPIVAKISNDVARMDLPIVARSLWRQWARIQGRFIDRWIVMEPSLLPDVMAAIRPAAASVTVVPDPAISSAQWARLGEAPRRAVGIAPTITRGRAFVAIGRLVGQKDYPAMLRGFAEGAHSTHTLTIFGEGPARGALERSIRRLDLAAQVTLAGHVADAAARLPQFDALLLSSAYEGVPAVVVEALAARLPVIATDCGPGVRALLDEGRLGTIVERGDDEAFGAAIHTLRDDPSLDEARRTQAARFTLDASADRYLEVLQAAGLTARVTTIQQPRPCSTRPVNQR